MAKSEASSSGSGGINDAGAGSLTVAKTLHDFADYFVRHIGTLEGDASRRKAVRVLGDILERNLGIQTVEFLGGGSFGVAAEIEDGRVLKITTDPTEVPAASAIVGESLRYVVAFHGAWFVEGFSMRGRATFGGRGPVPVGVLLSDKVDVVGLIDGEGEYALGRAVNEVMGQYDIMGRDLDEFQNEDVREIVCEASIVLESRLLALEGAPWEVGMGLAELRAYGICVVDVHSSNVGFDEKAGVHKIFDIGLASSKRRRLPKIAGQGDR